jgi:hypothetical protein
MANFKLSICLAGFHIPDLHITNFALVALFKLVVERSALCQALKIL